MNELNNRFIEFYNYLISQKIVKSAKDFAEKTDVSSSLITEITHGRSIPGTRVIQNSVIKYGLNSDWLFTGVGLMIKIDTNIDKSVKLIDNTSMGFILDRYEALAIENSELKKENDELKKENAKLKQFNKKSTNQIPYQENLPELRTSIAADSANK